MITNSTSAPRHTYVATRRFEPPVTSNDTTAKAMGTTRGGNAPGPFVSNSVALPATDPADSTLLAPVEATTDSVA